MYLAGGGGESMMLSWVAGLEQSSLSASEELSHDLVANDIVHYANSALLQLLHIAHNYASFVSKGELLL